MKGCLWLGVEGHHIPASWKEPEQSRGLLHSCLPQPNKVPLGPASLLAVFDLVQTCDARTHATRLFPQHVTGHGELTNTDSGAL